jgi:ribosomal protein S18 acetylase RimI-like enzyme
MLVLEPITSDNLQAFKSVRLQALQQDPGAFGSTYARESQFTHAEWAARLARWDGQQGIGFLATHNGTACGIAGALLDSANSSLAQLVSMWTAPTHRRLGAGRLLVDGVIAWAQRRGVRTLQLSVVSTNDSAINFYESLAFTKTGRTEPYPNDPNLFEYEMAKNL